TTTIPSGQTTTYGGTGTNGLLVTVGGAADDARQTFYVYPFINNVASTTISNADRENASIVLTNSTANNARFGSSTSPTVDFTGGFGSVSASVTSWSDTSVTITVPTGIANNVYLGDITLTRNATDGNKADNAYDSNGFRILPRILSTNPTNPVKTENVEIVGDHLCQAGSASCPSAFDVDNKITFYNGVDATNFISWNNTSATTTVPATAQSGNLVLKSNGYDSNALNITLASTAPNSPSNLQQFKTNGTTEILVNSGTNETSIILEGDLSSGVSITMFLEVEVKLIGEAFNGTVSASSSLFTGTSFTNATATVSGLTGGSQYHWRARAQNKNTGETSAWSAYGDNPAGDGATDGSPANRDFYIDITGPVITGVGTANLSDIQTDITWTTDESANRWVAYGTSSCPTGQANASSTFDALANKAPSSPTGSATSHSVTLTNLTGSTLYYYIVRSADSFGNAS
ncbi:MAG: fibronectin type III domain-containing protein, partial [Patescibacteria group bacterium]